MDNYCDDYDLALLRVLACKGWASIRVLAAESGVPMSTAYRRVESYPARGWVVTRVVSGVGRPRTDYRVTVAGGQVLVDALSRFRREAAQTEDALRVLRARLADE